MSGAVTVEIAVPPGAVPGQTLQLNVRGKTVKIKVPEGVVPGQHLSIQIPASSTTPTPAPKPSAISSIFGGVDDRSLRDGDRVELHSLVASADLNGLSGTIDGYDIDTQRYTVKLDGGKGDRRIKESNLKKASIFSGIASSQAPPPTPAPRWEPPPPTTQPRSGAAGGGTGSSRRTRLVQRTVNSLNGIGRKRST